MKKIFLFALLCLPFVQLKAQQGIVFKVKYLPNHNYKVGFKVGIKLNATITGDPALMDNLSKSGFTSPIAVNMDMAMDGSTTTGALAADKSFPLNMSYMISNLSVEANGKQAPIPPKITEMNLKMTGHVNSEGQIQIDSAMGKKVSDTAQKKMQQTMNLFQKQIQFPDKPLKPGDSFTQTMPLNLPMGGNSSNNVQMNYSITYKLISISDGKAFFDVVPNFNMNFSIKDVTIAMSATGLGKMIYSIKDNFPVSSDGNFTMKLKVSSAKINVDGTALVTTNYTTVIN